MTIESLFLEPCYDADGIPFLEAFKKLKQRILTDLDKEYWDRLLAQSRD